MWADSKLHHGVWILTDELFGPARRMRIERIHAHGPIVEIGSYLPPPAIMYNFDFLLSDIGLPMAVEVKV